MGRGDWLFSCGGGGELLSFMVPESADVISSSRRELHSVWKQTGVTFGRFV